jgi:hypothetical protein
MLRLIRRLLFSLTLIVLSIGIIEIIVRGVFFFRPPTPSPIIVSDNPNLIYELNPGHPQINPQGLRQGPIDSLTNKFIIAVIGDSHTYSVKVKRWQDSFPARLEDHLGTLRGRPVKVLNFGVPGYNMAQELEVLRSKVLALHVDLVILQYCINDEHISNYIQPENMWLNRLIHRSVALPLLWKGILYSQLGRKYLQPRIEAIAPDLLLFEPGLVGAPNWGDQDPAHAVHPPRTKDRVPPRYHAVIGRETLERNVVTFGSLAQSANLPLLATGFIEERDRWLYEKSGFQVYSFFDMFRDQDMRVFGYDPQNTADHFSEPGNEAIGNALADFIRAKF